MGTLSGDDAVHKMRPALVGGVGLASLCLVASAAAASSQPSKERCTAIRGWDKALQSLDQSVPSQRLALARVFRRTAKHASGKLQQALLLEARLQEGEARAKTATENQQVIDRYLAEQTNKGLRNEIANAEQRCDPTGSQPKGHTN